MSGKRTRREELQAKIDRVHAAGINAEQFIDGGKGLASTKAMSICFVQRRSSPANSATQQFLKNIKRDGLGKGGTKSWFLFPSPS